MQLSPKWEQNFSSEINSIIFLSELMIFVVCYQTGNVYGPSLFEVWVWL